MKKLKLKFSINCPIESNDMQYQAKSEFGTFVVKILFSGFVSVKETVEDVHWVRTFIVSGYEIIDPNGIVLSEYPVKTKKEAFIIANQHLNQLKEAKDELIYEAPKKL